MKFCLIGNIYKALNGEYIGGAEKQCALLAQGLADAGHHVCVIDTAYSGTPYVCRGIEIIPVRHRESSLRGLRFVLHKIPSLLKEMKKINADVYYIRGITMSHGFTTQYVGNLEGKLVWALSGDGNISKKYQSFRKKNKTVYTRVLISFLTRVSTWWTMKKADVVFCQTEEQLNYVRRSVKNAVIVPNIFDGCYQLPKRNVNKKCCLWVGKLCGWKGESDLLDLSRIMTGYEFRVIGNIRDDFSRTTVMRGLENQANIRLLGKIPYTQVLDELSHGLVLICTSPSEGFSNTFLEAWACKCPVVSLKVNPNGLLSMGGLGYCANGDLNKMAAQIRKLNDDIELRDDIGKKAAEYVRSGHAAKVVVSRIESLLKKFS